MPTIGELGLTPEDVEVLNVNPGFTWHANDWIKVDGQVNWSRSNFFRQAPTVLFNTPLGAGLNVTYKNNGGDKPADVTELTAMSLKMSFLASSSHTAVSTVGSALV